MSRTGEFLRDTAADVADSAAILGLWSLRLGVRALFVATTAGAAVELANFGWQLYHGAPLTPNLSGSNSLPAAIAEQYGSSITDPRLAAEAAAAGAAAVAGYLALPSSGE